MELELARSVVALEIVGGAPAIAASSTPVTVQLSAPHLDVLLELEQPALELAAAPVLEILAPVLAVEIATVGVQGPPGSTGELLSSFVAGEPLSGHRAVYVDAGELYYASSDNASAFRVLGITTGAVAEGALAAVRLIGPMTEPSWSFTPGPIWLGLQGVLTQTPPETGVLIELGVALTPTQALVRVQDPIIQSS